MKGTRKAVRREAAAPGGVVEQCVRGGAGAGTAAGGPMAASEIIPRLRRGLPVRELESLQHALAVPMERLVPMLGISRATLHRRKAEGRLDPAESDRVVRFARLLGRAVEVLESEDAARQWLSAPQRGLGGAIPLEYAETEVGAREVEDLLGRIDEAVYG